MRWLDDPVELLAGTMIVLTVLCGVAQVYCLLTEDLSPEQLQQITIQNAIAAGQAAGIH